MGRDIYTEQTQKAIDERKPDPAYFILGPAPINVSASGVRAELMRGATPSDSLHPSVLHWLQTNPRSPYASYYHQHLTSSPSTGGGSRLLSAQTQGCEVLTPFLQSLPA